LSVQSAAFWRGARESIGAPIAVIAANYLGLGAFASATAVSVWALVVSTFTIWALPGQLVMVDMWMVGAPAVAVLLAVMLTNVRFLPMSITIMPVMRAPGHPRWLYYVTAHFIAMTSWVVCMPRLQQMPAIERIAYFIGFSLTCIVVGAIFGALGYYAAEVIPPAVQLGLIFLTPINFFVLLAGEVRDRMGALALAGGAIAGPLFHLVTPEWSVIFAGVVGGTLAFGINKFIEARRV
jgi:predicted branched-subunit amino acid permease